VRRTAQKIQTDLNEGKRSLTQTLARAIAEKEVRERRERLKERLNVESNAEENPTRFQGFSGFSNPPIAPKKRKRGGE